MKVLLLAVLYGGGSEQWNNKFNRIQAIEGHFWVHACVVAVW